MRYNKIYLTLGIALVLALLVATVPGAPVLAAGDFDFTPNRGKIGDSIECFGYGFSGDPILRIYFSSDEAFINDEIDDEVDTYKHIANRGAVSAAFVFDFNVPDELIDGTDDKDVRGGSYFIYATVEGSKKIIARGTFTVESTGEITGVDPKEGAVGSKVEITGEGFDNRENIIVEYDGDEVEIAEGDTDTNSSGDFESIILIPESTAGAHTITVIGDDSGIEASAEFTTKPWITIVPASGTTGETVTVNGTGFGEEVDFSIFFADVEIVADGTTNRKGSLGVTFVVPSKAVGSYDVEAGDKDDNSYKVTFTTAASSVSLSSTSGPAGSEVTLSGTGFQASKPITITFDNTVMDTVTSDEQGKFTATFAVPVRTSGSYEVKASDDINAVTTNFAIGIKATIIPVTSAAAPGYVGVTVTISGVGFMPGGTVKVTYNGTQVTTAIVGTNGDFSTTFNAPAGSGGQFPIIATDGTNSKQFIFFMESNPPPAPAPLKPEMGVKVKAEAYFDWEEITDASLPVTYILQIATNGNFSADSIVLEKKLSGSEYTLTKEERLESVSEGAPYYWHVRAVDGAGNEGEWTGTRSFSVGFTFGLSPATTYTLFVLGGLLLVGFGFWLGRKTAYI